MSAPLLRVVVAGVPASRTTSWLQALSHQLPDSVSCVAWPVSDPLDTDLVLFLASEATPASNDFEAASALRATLAAQVPAYQVIQPTDAWQQARHAIGRALLPVAPSVAQPLLRPDIPVRWRGLCEGCSDPDCEHRLFTGLPRRQA